VSEAVRSSPRGAGRGGPGAAGAAFGWLGDLLRPLRPQLRDLPGRRPMRGVPCLRYAARKDLSAVGRSPERHGFEAFTTCLTTRISSNTRNHSWHSGDYARQQRAQNIAGWHDVTDTEAEDLLDRSRTITRWAARSWTSSGHGWPTNEAARHPPAHSSQSPLASCQVTRRC
jgi:hypothetical protein